MPCLIGKEGLIMQRFKNILLVAGGEGWEGAALNRAVALAKNNRARLTVVDVVEELPRDMRVLVTSMHLADLQKLAVAERLKDLQQHIEPVIAKSFRITAKVLVGTPFIEIIREVLKNKHDLVMKTARGVSRLKEVIFGSTAMHLMRKCPCPVWVIKPEHQKKFSRIMAAVDPDPIDKKRNALNTKIMELATSLARIEGSELHVVHAWRLYGETLLSGSGRMSQSEVNKLAHQARMEHKDWIAELVGKYAPGLPKNRIHLLKGDAEVLIPALAKIKKIELIVMGTVCRTGLAGFIVGNTAENILQQVDCSVLAVKPDGFVSPVKR
jgi:universal stress protein E